MTVLQTTVEIRTIEIIPDRFGRLYPNIVVVITDTDTKCHLNIPLSIDDLIKLDYQEGDIVELSFVGRIPRLGRVIKSIWDPTIHSKYSAASLMSNKNNRCNYCTYPLIVRNRECYCDNPTCYFKNIAKLEYACHSSVLNLPVDPFNLSIWYTHVCEDVAAPVTTLLTTERNVLSCINDNPDEMDYLADLFVTRHNQLYGYAYSSKIQNFTQGRFIDALSLRGLYQNNITDLQRGLAQNRWRWSDLPDILTDTKHLQKYDISSRNARDIKQSALIGIDEITSFASL